MTDHNLFQEIQDDLDRQKLMDFWNRYGSWIIACAVIIVLTTAGMTMWRSWQTEKHQEATTDFMRIMNQTDPAKQIAELEDFAQKNPGVSQAAFARLEAAAIAMKEGQKDKAVQLYDAIAEDSSIDTAYRQLADLMSVQAQMDTAAPATLEKRLQPLLADNAPWRYTAMEYKGYLALKAGDKAKAHQVFTELSQDAGAPKSLSTRATDMLHIAAE